MRCNACGKTMRQKKGMKFNDYRIDGWRCACGERYYDPAQAQKVLLLNKLKKDAIRAKLGRSRSNLILRLPKGIEEALKLEKGDDVLITVEKEGLKIVPA